VRYAVLRIIFKFITSVIEIDGQIPSWRIYKLDARSATGGTI